VILLGGGGGERAVPFHPSFSLSHSFHTFSFAEFLNELLLNLVLGVCAISRLQCLNLIFFFCRLRPYFAFYVALKRRSITLLK